MENLISKNKNESSAKDTTKNIFSIQEQPISSYIWVYLLTQTIIWVGIASLVITLAV